MDDKYARVIIPEYTREIVGVTFQSITTVANAVIAVNAARAIFIGCGNTFLLLKRLQGNNIVEAIRQIVQDGMPYIGVGAGSNVATVSIKTTNDMPIVHPQTFAALALVPFNINPHFEIKDKTKAKQIEEFLGFQDSPPVLGLCLGCNILVENGSVILTGQGVAKLFRRDNETDLVVDELLARGANIMNVLQ